MGKWLMSLGLFVLPMVLFGSDYSYQVKKNVKWLEIATVDFSNISFASAEITQEFSAPEPGVKEEVRRIKSQLDQQKVRRFTRLDKNAVYDRDGGSVKPDVETDFDGLPVSLAGIPNDNNMAISNQGMIVSVINSSVSIFDENGTRLLFRTLASIVGTQHSGLNRTYDPKVMYDPDNDRFILVFLQGSTSEDTRIMVGFSQSNDPTKTWKFYAVDGNPFEGPTWSDYPIIGSTSEDLFITVNILRDSASWQEGFTQSVIWQIQKSGGFDGSDSLNSDLYHGLKYKGKPLWSICVVQGGEKFNARSAWFLTVRPSAESNDTLFVHTINNTWASREAAYSLEVYKTDKTYGVPPSAFQPELGYLLQTNDARVLSAFEHQGQIQYVQTTRIPGTLMSGVFHGILTVKEPEFLVHANYIASDTLEFAYPSITYAGDMDHPFASVITYSHVSELDYAGTSCMFHNKVDNHHSVYSPNVFIKKGDGLIDTFLPDSIERWGDYTGIQRKYNEPRVVWMCGSFGNQDSRNSVWIGKVRVDNNLALVSAETGIAVYPNPAGEEFNLDLDLDEAASIQVLLYDAGGKLVKELISRDLQGGRHMIRVHMDFLNTAALRPGIYFIQIKKNGDETIHSQKMFVH